MDDIEPRNIEEWIISMKIGAALAPLPPEQQLQIVRSFKAAIDGGDWTCPDCRTFHRRAERAAYCKMCHTMRGSEER